VIRKGRLVGRAGKNGRVRESIQGDRQVESSPVQSSRCWSAVQRTARYLSLKAEEEERGKLLEKRMMFAYVADRQ
jgi:nitroimidazol reductase NimA-like FMN-containing flavoprotein (pyridoxamine 5'-phosphate oxidase superfamily)